MPQQRMQIILVRHAEMKGDPYACPALPVNDCLSDAGVAQAQQARRALVDVPIAAAFVSPYGRALQTAQIMLAGRAAKLQVCAYLREWLPNPHVRLVPAGEGDAVLQRATDAYVEEQWQTDLGEGCFEMHARICPPFLADLAAHGVHHRMGGFVIDPSAREQQFLVVAHGGSLNVLLGFLLGLPPFPLGRFAFALTGMATLTFVERKGIFHPQLSVPAAAAPPGA